MQKTKQKIKTKLIGPIVGAVSMFVVIAFSQNIFAQEQYQQAPALIHISSIISDGLYAPEQIVAIAREAGFEIVILNEREIMRWEYGLWPLRNIIKKTVENNSLAVFGIKNYFKLIEEINRKAKDIIVIPGVESTPFYFWSGSIFAKNFTLNDAHKHLLIIGLSQTALANLPVVGNRFSLYENYQLESIINFWPILVLLTGFLLVFNSKKKYFRNSLEIEAYRNKKIFAIILSCLGLIFCLNNYPFKTLLFDQYHGDRGVLPYQKVIDYVNKQGGMVFWAHPEAENCSKTQYVDIITKKHVQDFYNTRNYAGFSVFYEGYELIGKPGGLWDKVLKEYLEGKRQKPVWAIAGLAFDFSKDLKESLKDLRNMVLIDDFSNKGVLDALNQGRVYAIRGQKSSEFILDNFSIEDPESQEVKVMGQTLITNSPDIKIKIKGHFIDKNKINQVIQVYLIKNGKIIKIFSEKDLFDIEFTAEKSKDKKDFYRIEIKSTGLHLITNPIFVN
ncbi:MAG: hypothetical protein V1747_08380 [Candidatus Omnitrophota bacterium]